MEDINVKGLNMEITNQGIIKEKESDFLLVLLRPFTKINWKNR